MFPHHSLWPFPAPHPFPRMMFLIPVNQMISLKPKYGLTVSLFKILHQFPTAFRMKSKHQSLTHNYSWPSTWQHDAFIHTEHESPNVHELNIHAFTHLSAMLFSLITLELILIASSMAHSAVLCSGKSYSVYRQHQRILFSADRREFIIALITVYSICFISLCWNINSVKAQAKSICLCKPIIKQNLVQS